MTNLSKPVRRVARGVIGKGQGFSPDLVLVIYPGAVIGIRESKRRREYQFSAVALLERAIKAEVEAKLSKRKKRRRSR